MGDKDIVAPASPAKSVPGAVTPPKRPVPPPVPASSRIAPPGQPFANSCSTDAAEIVKLPHQGIDIGWPNESKKLKKLSENALKWFEGAPAPSSGNVVVPYIYGRCAFDDIAEALASAVSPDHRIYLVGWHVLPWTRMKNQPGGEPPANTLLQDYLRKTKAQVRGLFWNTPFKGKDGDNKAIADFINSLPNGAALEDGRLVPADLPVRGPNAHHQKLVVVSGDRGLVAFLGGMDLHISRVDVGGVSPLHDVHIRLNGPSAAAALAVFRDRWLDHPATPALDKAKFQMTADDVRQDFSRVAGLRSEVMDTCTVPGGKVKTRRMLVSIGRTFPDLTKFKPGDSYKFKYPDQSAWQLVKNGIANAREYIYVEDQYLVSRRAKEALVAKLKEPGFKFLLILMSNSYHFEHSNIIQDNEFPYLIGVRNEFRTDFAKVDPGRKKWRMFSLKETKDPGRRPWCGDFVHSKLWIFDDEYVAVGSANCDDRGYTYDTEIMAGITEEPLERAAGGRFARDLRIALWRKHLGLPHAQFVDIAAGLRHWLNLPPSAMVYDSSDLETSLC
ncbi:phospholipase D family protein [Paenibacillus hamazuiensis]|uniref:phospholipase D family protein n=1 Tax=Paenibacillus hamazuiensis TaxID=2936508 RepID=UPI00200FD4CD|nr:phospholipase D-like domain-containing protein [Paenibacillus hamazuiensis]